MSRFVSAGTDADSRPRDDVWLKAQLEVESQRKPKPSEDGKQEGGKSLYEVLQANKGRMLLAATFTYSSCLPSNAAAFPLTQPPSRKHSKRLLG